MRGVALIITLGAVVIITVMIVAFLSHATLNRSISLSSAGQFRSDRLAKTGLETLVGDLRAEIVAGSTSSTTNGIVIYQPSINTTVVPCRVGNGGYPNMLKRSASGLSFWTGSDYSASVRAPVRSGSNNSTAALSTNGRFIQADRWNAPYLLGGSLPADFVAPDWVVVTRAGAIGDATALPSLSDLANKSASNTKYAIGRFAYVIYDEGGLLDVNVAGYPSGVTTDFTSRRGVLPQVGLENISGIDTIPNASALVTWRNQTTASDVTSYTNYVLSATNGFVMVASGDQTFLSRRDLINYAKANPSQLQLKALQYLGTYTRALNAPSYTPNSTRAKVGANDDVFNPSLINTRVSGTFTRDSDGTTAQVGEPLLKYRFPLSRLALITDGTTASASSTIYKYFGLTRSSSSDPWVYNHGDATRIFSLADVAAAGREPDFFELLQAAIAFGSLGQGLKGNTFANRYSLDTALYTQIIQIGANLIDQYDTDSYPTRITFNSNTYCGVENLPYIARIFELPYSTPGSGKYGYWFQPEIWNPHVNPTAAMSSGPTKFRFICSGTAEVIIQNSTGTSSAKTKGNFSNSSGLTFSISAAQTFSTPTLLSPSNATASGSDVMNDGKVNFIGVCAGVAAGISSTTTIPYTMAYFAAGSSSPVSHQLQYYRDSDTTWVTYSSIANVTGGATTVAGDGFYTYRNLVDEIRSDPRTDRFGVFAGYLTLSNNEYPGQSIRPTTARGILYSKGWPGSNNPAWTAGSPGYLGYLSENGTSSSIHYADPDGTVRRADGAYVDGNLADGGYPLATDSVNNPSSRPVVLNRLFRSVAEMGYAFRDEPWKHLDFFTAESADAALLDVFCLNESPAPAHPSQSTDPVPIAGGLNLNTQQTAVLGAVLAGVIKADEADSTLSSSEAEALARNLAAMTKASPLLNRSELVMRWISASNIKSCFGTAADAVIKRRREAAIRALSDVGNVRTWNLLIDIIAQSGRYPKSPKSLNDFVVEGERRYWLHVAIDRYTGKVVSQFLEPVYE